MLKSKTHRAMVEAGGRLCQILNLPRSTGQIYGLLYLSISPLSLDDICQRLTISRGSASMGARQLLKWGAIRHVWVEGQRRDFFQVIPDLDTLIRASYTHYVKPRITSANRRVESMTAGLDDDLKNGTLTQEEYELCVQRLKGLGKLHRKFSNLTPMAESFI